MATLCLLSENGSTAERWDIGDGPIAVGRDCTSDLVIEDGALSRRHFLISRQGSAFFLSDLKSQNGTWVDGQRAALARLHHNDCIFAGRTLFVFSENTYPDAVAVYPSALPDAAAVQDSASVTSVSRAE